MYDPFSCVDFHLVIDLGQIGLAMRLAIAFGCNLPENEQACLPSQSAHRVRLWWTVYMLDRYFLILALPKSGYEYAQALIVGSWIGCRGR